MHAVVVGSYPFMSNMLAYRNQDGKFPVALSYGRGTK
jgi:hypothetical protein